MSGFRWLDPLPELTGTVRIPIDAFAKYEAKLGLNMRQAVFTRAMPEAARGVRALLEEETRRRKIVFRGAYAKGWRMQQSTVPSAVRMYNKQPYAIIIERGRRIGARRPPAEALVPWVRAKLGVRGAEARRVAFLVARKISERGIQGRPLLRDPRVQARIQKMVTRVVVGKLREAIARTR